MATQFFSALRYIGTHHDAVPVGNEAKVTDDTGITPPSPLPPILPPLSYLTNIPTAVIDDKTTFDGTTPASTEMQKLI